MVNQTREQSLTEISFMTAHYISPNYQSVSGRIPSRQCQNNARY